MKYHINVCNYKLPCTQLFLNMVTSDSGTVPVRVSSKMQSPSSVDIPDQHVWRAAHSLSHRLVDMLVNVASLLELKIVERPHSPKKTKQLLL